MSFSRTVVLVSGFALVASGCTGGTEAVDFDVEEIGAQPLTGDDCGGCGTGTNGLPSADFHQNEWKLRDVLGESVVETDEHGDIFAVTNGLLDTEAGVNVFKYALRCGVDEDQVVVKDLTGGGMLSTTGAWVTVGLGDPARSDVYTCMLGHLNPSGTEVPIMMKGAAITPGSHSGPLEVPLSAFGFQEAVWATVIDPLTHRPFYHVWPQAHLLSHCTNPALLAVALRSRVCGLGVQDCGLTIHSNPLDFATDCSGSDGVYTCLGYRAIETWLVTEDRDEIYGACVQ
ncbi:hypothetical protein [Chondromyces apiculatus]|uniref:Lipoprotein n=1 Tax=Chondromyces apiculatus DSM 436 TaxID=1192034 RepID=A0A017SUW5_9BACT|nr:hypothetical protein [Chondromyces apiculatus]EYF00056.1 Hypothetical protein CAP_1407 [Chondromyces apiculatus DSM 436]